MGRELRCLTVLEPWATAIVKLGKCIENRTWCVSYRGPILIHAGKSRRMFDMINPIWWQATFGSPMPKPQDCRFGAIIGAADLTACHDRSKWVQDYQEQGDKLRHAEEMLSHWAEGPYCWVLENRRPSPVPVPYIGAGGLFRIDRKDFVARLEAAKQKHRKARDA